MLILSVSIYENSHSPIRQIFTKRHRSPAQIEQFDQTETRFNRKTFTSLDLNSIEKYVIT